MQHPIEAAISHYREDKDPKDPEVLNLPMNGLVLEPLVGRMNPVSSVLPPQFEKMVPRPDPTRKVLRSNIFEMYEEGKEPAQGNEVIATMKLVHLACPTIKVRLRSDLDPEVAKRVEKEGYRAQWGPTRYNKRRRSTAVLYDYNFEAGVEYPLATAQAVYLLCDRMHGQYMEEVPFESPTPTKTKKTTTRKKRTASKTPKSSEVKDAADA